MQVLGAVVEREAVQRCRGCRGGGAGVRSPRTYGSHTGRSAGSTAATAAGSGSPTQRRTRSRNSPPALLGPPIIVMPAAVCGMVQRPGTSAHSSITPHVMSVAPQMTSTSPAASAPATICSPIASIVPPPTSAPAAGEAVPDRPGRLDAAHDVGQRRGRGARLGGERLVPPDEVEQRVGRHRRRRVDGAAAGEGVVGHRLRGPVTRPRPGGWRRATPGRRAARRCRPGWVGSRAVALAAVVAVEQARVRRRARRRRRRRATAPSPTR